MAKTTRLVDGRVTTLTKHQKRSTETPIPWTPGPQTWWERRKRDWVG
jgi:hypothetical protein